MRKLLYVLWSVAAMMVIANSWEDIWWEIEYAWGELPFNQKEKPARSVTGIPVSGHLKTNNILVGPLVFEDSKISEKHLLITTAASTAEEGGGLLDGKFAITLTQEFYARQFDTKNHEIKLDCYGQNKVNFSLVDISDAYVTGPVFQERVYIIGLSLITSDEQRLLLLLYTDVDSDSNGYLNCNDDLKIALYDVDANSLISSKLPSNARSLGNVLVVSNPSDNKVLVTPKYNAEVLPFIVDLHAGTVEKILKDDLKSKIEAIVNRQNRAQ